MVILKKFFNIKLKASSLTEVMVATVIILIVFGIATATLNTVFTQSVKNKSFFITTELDQLQYEYHHQKIKVPLIYEEGEWQISVLEVEENNKRIVLFEGKNNKNGKTITRKQLVE